MKWLLKFCFLNQLFSGGGGREGKVNYNKDLPCFPRHLALLVKFAVCRPMYKENQDSLGFRIPDTGFQSLSEELGFWIPIVSGIRNLELYSGFD